MKPNPQKNATHTPGATRAAYAILKHPEINCGVFAHIAEELAGIIDRETAAPELMEALERALERIKFFDEDYDLDDVYCAGIAALARATGGKP